MNPRFMRLRPELTVDEAIRYLGKQGVDASLPIIYFTVAGFVLRGTLLGAVKKGTVRSDKRAATLQR